MLGNDYIIYGEVAGPYYLVQEISTKIWSLYDTSCYRFLFHMKREPIMDPFDGLSDDDINNLAEELDLFNTSAHYHELCEGICETLLTIDDTIDLYIFCLVCGYNKDTDGHIVYWLVNKMGLLIKNYNERK
jgi:hypothetical protein